jgi:hypothetical protein
MTKSEEQIMRMLLCGARLELEWIAKELPEYLPHKRERENVILELRKSERVDLPGNTKEPIPEVKATTVKTIIKEWLEAQGFEGLACENCGCGFDSFMICQDWDTPGNIGDCQPAYKNKCRKDCPRHETDCYGEPGKTCYGIERKTDGS